MGSLFDQATVLGSDQAHYNTDNLQNGTVTQQDEFISGNIPQNILESSKDVQDDCSGQGQQNGTSKQADVQYPRGLYFIRKPRPDLTLDDIQIQKHRIQFEQYKLIFQQYQETAKIIMVKRDQAKESTQKALDAIRSTKDEIQPRREKLQGYALTDPTKRDKVREMEKSLPVGVRSEEDLDNLLSQINYSLTHETLTLQQEKKYVNDLARLHKVRIAVQEYEENFKEVQKQRDDIKQFEPERVKMRAELDQLNKQKLMAGNIYGECKKQLEQIRGHLSEVQAKRDEARAEKDKAYDQWLQAKEGKKAKLDEFRKNREFSKEIRSHVESGNFSEAIEMCNEQIENMMEELKDKAYRKEYIKLWEVQKSRPIHEADFKIDNVISDNDNSKVKIPQEKLKETQDYLKQMVSDVNKASKQIPNEQVDEETVENLKENVSSQAQGKGKSGEDITDKSIKTRALDDNAIADDVPIKEIGSLQKDINKDNIAIQEFELPSAILAKDLSQSKKDDQKTREYNQRRQEEAERRRTRQEERKVSKLRKREEQKSKQDEQKTQQESTAEISQDEQMDAQPITSGDELADGATSKQLPEDTVPQQDTRNGSVSKKGKSSSKYEKGIKKPQFMKPPKKSEKSQSQKVMVRAQRFAEKNQASLIFGGVMSAVLVIGILYTITA